MLGCRCIHRDECGYLLSVCGSTEFPLPIDEKIAMFPNPTSNYVCLYFFDEGERIVTIKKKAGKEMLRQNISISDAAFDISDYPAGKYILIIDDGKEKSKWCLFKE